ncbi:MAG TPA: hypothetical protein PK699_00100 [bacterium]|nr:hypothetical protein [bacterium]
MSFKELEEIVEDILLSSKYKNINKRTISEIAKIESCKYKGKKSLVKAIKNKLHQIYGAFLTERDIEKINRLLDVLETDSRTLKETSKKILLLHCSTRERIESYETLYREIFSLTGNPKSILDLACGFNPYSIPWMDICGPIEYYAYDIDSLLIESINRFLGMINYPKLAIVKDIIFEDVEEYGDVCFIFKFLPTAERVKKGASIELLEKIKSQFIIVSFPLKSIGGKRKGMLENYSKIFEPVFTQRYIIMKRFILEEEVFYILRRGK